MTYSSPDPADELPAVAATTGSVMNNEELDDDAEHVGTPVGDLEKAARPDVTDDVNQDVREHG